MALTKAYRYVTEGTGGTLFIRDPGDEGRRDDSKSYELLLDIGTRSLLTCVGVYFKINATRAFFAHIDAYKEDAEDGCDYIVNEAEGERLKQEVIGRLWKDAKTNGWEPANIDKHSPILVCPSHRAIPPGGSPPATKRAGLWVIEGIKEFLKLPSDTMADCEHEGFVVNHRTGDVVVWVPYSEEKSPRKEKPETLKEYDEKIEPCKKGWTIGVSSLAEADDEDD